MNTKTNKSGATTMAELLKNHKKLINPLHTGDKVTGIITKLTPSEILMDISFKTEAIVIEKERNLMKNLLSVVQLGDKVTGNVISPEAENGHPIITLRPYVENLIWDKLEKIHKNQEKLKIIIRETTRGGYIVETPDGLSGFLPNSHVSLNQKSEILVGQSTNASILELNRESKKIIFSQKAMLSADDFKKSIKKWNIGSIVIGNIATITPFGLFISILSGTDQNDKKSIDGLVHISEISWDIVPEDLNTIYNIGQEIEAVIVGLDENSKRIDLSIKRLTQDPYEEALKKYSIDQKVTGTVIKVSDNSINIELGTIGDLLIEGLIRKDKIPPNTSYQIGEKLNAIITQIDTRRHKIIMSPILLEKPIGYR